MEEKVYDMSSYKLHLIKTKKFKTTRVYFNFRKPIKKEDITSRNFLCDMMLDSTKEYKTPRDIVIKTEELYSTYMYSVNRRLGNYLVSSFVLSCLNDKYTEEGNFDKAFNLFSEVIFNPNVENKSFDEKRFDVIKMDAKAEIESVKQNRGKYALIRGVEESGDDIYSIRDYGYLEDLENITPSNLYEIYNNMIKSDILDIVVIGDFEFYDMKEYIKKRVKINTIKKEKGDIYFSGHKLRKRIKKVNEVMNVEQAKMSMVLKLGKLTKFEKNYVLKVYNHILGGAGFRSLLLDVIREKHSFAYSVHSYFSSLDGLIYTLAGIDSKNSDKVYKLFREVLNRIKKGKFDDELIKGAKMKFVHDLKDDMDFPSYIVNNYYFRILTDGDSYDKKVENINKVTKEDVMKFAKKVYPDTMFLLWEGDKNAKE